MPDLWIALLASFVFAASLALAYTIGFRRGRVSAIAEHFTRMVAGAGCPGADAAVRRSSPLSEDARRFNRRKFL
jgi:hypothetical protein